MQLIRGHLLAAALAIFAATPTSAAELKILAGGNMAAILPTLAADFERTSGHKLSIAYDTAGPIKNRIQNGEQVDVVIVVRPVLDDLAKAGKIAPTSIADIANTPIAVFVRSGAPQPNIGSTGDFTRTLLAAKSIARNNPAAGGSAAVYLAGVIDRLGLTDQLKAKTKLAPPRGGNVADLVAKGDAEIGFAILSEVIDHKGIDFVKPLPDELKPKLLFLVAAGVPADSQEKEAATALIKFLTSPAAASAMKSKGMDPA